jgi:site-specific recombinase XerD
VLHVRRVKSGTPSTHPIQGDELRAPAPPPAGEPDVAFRLRERSRLAVHYAGFARMIERAGAEVGFDFKAHPHMLRHAYGYALAHAGHALQAYLGHTNIQHAVRYTELAPTRFKDFWR